MHRTELTIEQILQWADAYHERTGRWPTAKSGQVKETLDESWRGMENALRMGLRGLNRGQSLARLLAKHRGKRNRMALPPYTVLQILKWADAFYARTGNWPHRDDGLIPGTNGETWNAVELALTHGHRGMPGGSSLARVLAAERGVKNSMARPRLTVPKILSWADDHRRQTGTWPNEESGPIGKEDETWRGVAQALRKGLRGLRRLSLASLLQRHRGVPIKHHRLQPLTIQQILAWGDEHHARTGKWPLTKVGPIQGVAGETWGRIESALRRGTRGLPGGMSLMQLWVTHRGARCHLALPPLEQEQIIEWARAYKRENGCWPHRDAGHITGTDETWCGIWKALAKGRRGLPCTTLTRLLAAHG